MGSRGLLSVRLVTSYVPAGQIENAVIAKPRESIYFWSLLLIACLVVGIALRLVRPFAVDLLMNGLSPEASNRVWGGMAAPLALLAVYAVVALGTKSRRRGLSLWKWLLSIHFGHGSG